VEEEELTMVTHSLMMILVLMLAQMQEEDKLELQIEDDNKTISSNNLSKYKTEKDPQILEELLNNRIKCQLKARLQAYSRNLLA